MADNEQRHDRLRVLVITGPVGVGKTSVAIAVGEELKRRNEPHAVVDADWLRWAEPVPPDDRFNSRLGHRNLAAVSVNFRAAGARWLIVADVIEDEGDRAAYRAAIPDASLAIVRLRAPLDVIHDRLDGRETGHGLVWHKDRAIELAAMMDERAVEDILVETDARPVAEIAREVLDRVDGSEGADSDTPE